MGIINNSKCGSPECDFIFRAGINRDRIWFAYVFIKKIHEGERIMARCLYCDKEIPVLEKDSLGRKITKIPKFCRGTQCKKKYWDKYNKDHIRKYERERYLKKKGEINEVDKKT